MAEEVPMKEAYRRLRACLSPEELGNMYLDELIAEVRNELGRLGSRAEADSQKGN